MKSMSLDEFRQIVRNIEQDMPDEVSSADRKKPNGMSAQLQEYLDSLSDPSVMEAEVARLSAEFGTLRCCAS